MFINKQRPRIALANRACAPLNMPRDPRVIQLYKNLLFAGKDYPLGYKHFREKLKSAFLKNASVSDPRTLQSLLNRGNYVIKELESLRYLRKYRALKTRYYDRETPNT